MAKTTCNEVVDLSSVLPLILGWTKQEEKVLLTMSNSLVDGYYPSTEDVAFILTKCLAQIYDYGTKN